MNFDYSDKVKNLIAEVEAFMDENVYPNEKVYRQQLNDGGERWQIPPVIEEVKARARQAGLWNLFLPGSGHGAGLSNLEYAPLCEIMGRSPIGPEAFNCAAPDTGNMEVLDRYGTPEQQEKWLTPLLAGEIRSAFLMTEPDVASSDATNIQCSIRREGDGYVVNGRKWWSSGAMDPRCKIYIVMGKTDESAPKFSRQSMILVEAGAPGVTIEKFLPVFGFDDAPHGHAQILLKDVRVPAANLLLGEGRGFEIAQGRLGPGRIHHCMRNIGACERALEMMCARLDGRSAFGKAISEQGVWHERIANARVDIEMTRLLTLKAAYMMDTVGNKAARAEIGMIKIVGPSVAQKILDETIQAFGGAGVTDHWLSSTWSWMRALRLADGPDEVHRQQLARLELKRQRARRGG